MNETVLNDHLSTVQAKFIAYGLPEYMWRGIRGYLLDGTPVGDFLRNLLSNDLIGTYSHADNNNTAMMREWCWLLYNAMPTGSYGSREKYLAWLDVGGLRGKLSQEVSDESVPADME